MPADVHPMMLSDGSLLFRDEECAFRITRLRPGVLLTTISGRDRGQFADAPSRLIEAEHARFQRPVDWFVDARATANPSEKVAAAAGLARRSE